MLKNLILEYQAHYYGLEAKNDKPDKSWLNIEYNVRGLNALKEIQDAYIFKNTIDLEVIVEGITDYSERLYQITTKTTRGRRNYIELSICFSGGNTYGDVDSTYCSDYDEGLGVYLWEDVKSIILKSRNIGHLCRLRKEFLEGHEVKDLMELWG